MGKGTPKTPDVLGVPFSSWGGCQTFKLGNRGQDMFATGRWPWRSLSNALSEKVLQCKLQGLANSLHLRALKAPQLVQHTIPLILWSVWLEWGIVFPIWIEYQLGIATSCWLSSYGKAQHGDASQFLQLGETFETTLQQSRQRKTEPEISRLCREEAMWSSMVVALALGMGKRLSYLLFCKSETRTLTNRL